jgi:hypothetical protein
VLAVGVARECCCLIPAREATGLGIPGGEGREWRNFARKGKLDVILTFLFAVRYAYSKAVK